MTVAPLRFKPLRPVQGRAQLANGQCPFFTPTVRASSSYQAAQLLAEAFEREGYAPVISVVVAWPPNAVKPWRTREVRYTRSRNGRGGWLGSGKSSKASESQSS